MTSHRPAVFSVFRFSCAIVLASAGLPGSTSIAVEPDLPRSAERETDWPRWRGPSNTGSLAHGSFPTELSATTTVWKVRLPGKGCSTPIVHDETVYVTAPVDGHDALLAYDESGQLRWSAKFGPEVPGKHRNGSGCNASPTTDGEGIFVSFKSGTLAAVEPDGTVRWETNLVERFGKTVLFWDDGTSPALTQNDVVFARMHAGESWLAAFDKQTGELSWKVDRTYQVPTESDQCYTTPLVMTRHGKEVLLVWGAEHLTMHDAETGKIVWSCGNFNPEKIGLWPAIAMPVIVDQAAVICFGRNDKGAPRLFGVKLTGDGDVTDSNHLWDRNDISSFVPSPVAYRQLVYLVRDRGEVECVRPQTGQSVWSDRFPRARANYYASPLIAGGLLYAPREDGVVMVASIRDGKFEFLSENDLEEPVIGSPVPSGKRIYLRGNEHLFCFQADGKP